MIKVFDYEYPRRGWVEFDSYDSAKKHIEHALHEYWLYDKDNCYTAYMEIYNNGEYEVWCGEMGAWLGCGDETPYFNVYHGNRKEFEGELKFTTLHPRKDYILI
jgi:hypothetical protein